MKIIIEEKTSKDEEDTIIIRCDTFDYEADPSTKIKRRIINWHSK